MNHLVTWWLNQPKIGAPKNHQPPIFIHLVFWVGIYCGYLVGMIIGGFFQPIWKICGPSNSIISPNVGQWNMNKIWKPPLPPRLQLLFNETSVILKTKKYDVCYFSTTVTISQSSNWLNLMGMEQQQQKLQQKKPWPPPGTCPASAESSLLSKLLRPTCCQLLVENDWILIFDDVMK